MTVDVETTNAGSYTGVSPAGLERLVQQASDQNPYLIVTRDDRDGFAQAHVVAPRRDGRARLLVEYRENDTAPLKSAELVLERAAKALMGWAFDHTGWASGIRWRTEKLESVVALRRQCEFVDGAAGTRLCRLRGTPEACAADAPELAPVWEIVGHGANDDGAYSDFVTQIAERVNRAPLELRLAWSRWLSKWVEKVPLEQAQALRTYLDDDQQRRVRQSTRQFWPDAPSAEA